MKLKLEAPIDEIISIDVDKEILIGSIKQTISKITMIPPSHIMIYDNEILLEDSETVYERKDDENYILICKFPETAPRVEQQEENIPENLERHVQVLRELGFTQQNSVMALHETNYDLSKAFSLLSTKLAKKSKQGGSQKNSAHMQLQIDPRTVKEEALKKAQYNIERLTPDVSLHEYIQRLNASLPQDVTLDVGALTRIYLENDCNVYAAKAHFPQFSVGYLEFVLYWMVRTVTERISSQNSWSMEENRFVIEMAAIGHSFREIDAITYHKNSRSEDHRKALRRTLKKSWIIPQFAEQYPDCSQFPPGYTEDGIPSYLPELMIQIYKKPKNVEDEKIIQEALQNKSIMPQFKKEIVKLVQKLVSDPQDANKSSSPNEEEESLEQQEIGDILTDSTNLVSDEKHSRTNWPFHEDQLLVNLYAEAKLRNANRWEYIKKSFPNRSPKAIAAHFKNLLYEMKSGKRSDLQIPQVIMEDILKERTYSDEVKQLSQLTEMIDIIEAIKVYYQENGNWTLISRRLPQFKGGYIAFLLYYVCVLLKKTRRTKTWSMGELRFLLEKRVDGVPVQEISDLLQNKSPKQVDTKRTQIYSTIKTCPYLKQFVERFGKCEIEGAVYDDIGIPSYLPPMLETFKSEIREAVPDLPSN
ncbi:Myb-like DNA-binding domain containing protein [Trichomonas vaginalis G3]|uniref:Myb-like DNA-binding domain containing protein n=1 Tax=Trichomonas vaginalis (strain ATCC PRA-98 / G3) TaxID=412133 RepID=A2DKD5_TRIV3|nr:homeodomain-like family [Trichomonas vaginalis G3]EAY19112.1 Myb-like DNA-binding domain containing protein [Trichomonas vaginalis G3]KAI5490410.1 homeodomain-like family [Trichomonas vaginalis G3]|eukprot:XP_001580098.1 Myb-like DNA-binding domain containing protein [Trichomonas vaginalis G3]